MKTAVYEKLSLSLIYQYLNLFLQIEMHLLRAPTSDQMVMIANELNENSERLEHTVNLFRKWVSYQPHLPKNIGKYTP